MNKIQEVLALLVIFALCSKEERTPLVGYSVFPLSIWGVFFLFLVCVYKHVFLFCNKQEKHVYLETYKQIKISVFNFLLSLVLELNFSITAGPIL